ncbi:DEAD/DEAH box helicase [Virgibacillus flavescens]|uniref:DEAD/DEAH box helicase n=1 Tax=Virgibacillus flavescens TaxID=1611422 RepID=UPI003D3450BD
MSKVANKSFKEVLGYLRSISTSEADKGTRFELLIKKYFENDPVYSDLFRKVWTWNEFPLNGGNHDTGIDLIAEERISGKYCAIQCKFYDENYSIQKKDIDSFFTESGKNFYDSRIIVSSTDKWSKNAELSLENQSKSIVRIRLQDLNKSAINWSTFMVDNMDGVEFKKKHYLLPHQQEAHTNVLKGFTNANRGKLIMACGTGKTFTSLKIAEEVANQKQGNSVVLYLVPSISLLSQTLREWNNQTTTPFHTFAVCSDRKVSRTSEDITAIDLGFPATTNSDKIAENFKSLPKDSKMTVVFSTYQSIEVIHEAQEKGFPAFDLIIADEAHRTTGVTLSDGEESHFVRVHDNEYIQADKRLYQTATPKVFGDKTKNKADEKEAVLSSMDDASLFGEDFYNLAFGEAVERGLLTDYKVMVLVTDQNYVDVALANEIKSKSNTLKSSDFARIVGTWNGLSKRKSHSNEVVGKPMKRAVAFTSTIETSKQVTQIFQDVVDTYSQNSDISNGATVEIQHVDGTMNTLERNNRLDWLKDEPEDDNVCRILSNARCLTEGVDVPDLDSVIFFNPRNSVIDVIQAVGRVMRKADDKDYGYIILPVTINKGNDIETELNNNKEYKVVWQVLQALRSHDERFNAMINQMELNMNKPSNVEIIGHTGDKGDTGDGKDTNSKNDESRKLSEQIVATFPDLDELQDSIYGQIVDKVGDKRYWENWSSDVAEIAGRHFDRIKLLLRDRNSEPYAVFQKFLSDLRSNLNNSIEEDAAIEMLSQHLITKPVFDALFEDYSFIKNNPVSQAIENMLSVLEEENLEKETRALDKFYESVKTRASKIDNLAGKQKVIIELYDRFFGTAFKKTTERLGIVYTPIEVVDFIIHSVNEILSEEFNASFNDKNVNILDPFTGTGTFIVRLLQSGIIENKNLLYKFTNEIHANEIVLLAYYIAAINIEETFHSIYGGEYTPFEGVVLTDTFQMTEGKDTFVSDMFDENSNRAKKQNEKPIVAIMGNPPYSAKQKNENDNNKNEGYPDLDDSIKNTYIKESEARTTHSMYDSYIRAIRWASNRIEKNGVIGFVTNGTFIDSASADGLRKSLYEEFTSIYVFNLRGNQRTSGEESRREAGKIFGSGSRTPVAITVLVKNTDKSGCNLYYHDIGDYLSRNEKLDIIANKKSFLNMKSDLITIIPDQSNDWINQQSDEFGNFIALNGEATQIFSDRIVGISTSRDTWIMNHSPNTLLASAKKIIQSYTKELDRYKKEFDGKSELKDFINSNPKEIAWSRRLKRYLENRVEIEYDSNLITKIYYRPFTKKYFYNEIKLIENPSKWNKIFPHKEAKNYTIMTTGSSTIITDMYTDKNTLDGTNRVYSLYVYDEDTENDLFYEGGENRCSSNISDSILKSFRMKQGKEVTKEDIFFYTYGVLHSMEFKEKYANDFKKNTHRIPMVKNFFEFAKAGRELAELHLNYEDVEQYKVTETIKSDNKTDIYRVKKMKFGKGKDKSIIVYNDNITISDIPLEAYDYVVNGRSPMEWIMEHYQVKVDTTRGITNDPNEYSDNPRYILDLLKRVITVSIETNKIVDNLPDLEIIE